MLSRIEILTARYLSKRAKFLTLNTAEAIIGSTIHVSHHERLCDSPVIALSYSSHQAALLVLAVVFLGLTTS
jgi:hypothetical protein